MASTPPFIAGHFAVAPTAPVSFSTPNGDPTGTVTTGLTEVVEGGASGSIVREIRVVAVTETPADGTRINVFHLTGSTYRLVGQIEVPGGVDPQRVRAFEGVWQNPDAEGVLKSGDKYSVVAMKGSTQYVAYATGGDL
jgi:hypothetical protein